MSSAAVAVTFRYSPVSQQVIQSRLNEYKGSDQQRESTLKQMFVDAGCGQLSEQPVKGSKLSNLVCVLPGSSGKVIVVGAHFDHVSRGDGVVDNWSGASLLPSLYEALKNDNREHTFIFIGFAAEEQGEAGSRFYVQHMTREQVAATDAMVNMDTLGLAPTEVWASHANQHLFAAMLVLAKQLNMPVTGVNVDQVGSTDSEQFAARGIPSITIHSLTQQTWNEQILHTSKDRLSAMHLDDYYQTYRLVAAYVAFLDSFLQPATAAGTH